MECKHNWVTHRNSPPWEPTFICTKCHLQEDGYGEQWGGKETESTKHAILEYQENNKSLKIPDIRNKLSPITNMIALFERGEFAYIKNKGLDEVKKSINYLAQRDVYELP